jgi:uncharacterized membrane protein
LHETAHGQDDLHLSSHEFSISLAAFLAQEERFELAEALRKTLADMRQAT